MDMKRIDSVIEKRVEVCAEHGEFESQSVHILGKLMAWTRCPGCVRVQQEAEEKAKAIAREKERQAIIERRLNRAGIPLRFRSRSFANFEAKTRGQVAALNTAKDFANEFGERHRAGATMVFSGLPGTGKSHLAIAICMAVMEVGYTAMYVNALDAIRLVRSTWGKHSDKSERDVMNMLAELDLLVIDEVGAQYGTEGEQVILFDIINRRYQDQRPMVLLTNQGKDGFKAYLGDRAFDRLREAGKWVAFDWQSHRGQS